MKLEDLLFFLILYGVGLWIMLHVSRTLKQAGQSTPGHGPRTANFLIAGFWLWAIVANTYALLTGESFLWLVPSLVSPLLIVVAATFSKPVAEVLQHSSLPRLVGVQVYRTAGAVFLISYFVFDGNMSREFALKAGWGDVLTGLLALPVAYAALKRIPFWQFAVVAWCCLGIGDLILAPITAQLHGGIASNDYPLNSILVFFGPPLGITLHLVALRALWLQRAEKIEPVPSE